jgi:hypothetical protein
MHITSEYPAPLSPRVNLRIQGGGNNRPEWVATFAPESVATIIPEWVATFARNPHWFDTEVRVRAEVDCPHCHKSIDSSIFFRYRDPGE